MLGPEPTFRLELALVDSIQERRNLVGWFSSRQRRKREAAGKIYAGIQRSPGFEVICQFLETEPAYTILDLGPSSTESLEFLSEMCDDLVVQDVFHSSVNNTGARSETFRFESAKAVSLPNPNQKFDVILVWDLLHYLSPEDRAPFVRRLAERCAPNAMVLITASSIAEIPPEPIHFKALRRDRLEYCMGDERAESPGMTTRIVEQLMTGFVPLRNFQLRNGLQEMVFQVPEPPSSSEAQKEETLGPRESEAHHEARAEAPPEGADDGEFPKARAETPDPPATEASGDRPLGREPEPSSLSSPSDDPSSQSPSPPSSPSPEPSPSRSVDLRPGSSRSRRSRRRHSKR